MPKPRQLQIALGETPFYQLTYRCVRCFFFPNTASHFFTPGWLGLVENISDDCDCYGLIA
jgi:hypothetical protein